MNEKPPYEEIRERLKRVLPDLHHHALRKFYEETDWPDVERLLVAHDLDQELARPTDDERRGGPPVVR